MILTNSELILLVLIIENSEMSGYQINNLIKIRGCREWAGIGTTSVYKGLKKLEDLGFINNHLDIEKNTKGPIGKNYLVTTLGKKKLLDEIKLGLSEIREYDPRFKIALSGIYLLKKIEVCKLLNKRILFLKNESKRINTKKELTEHNNFIAQMLFEHSLQAINSEIKFTIYLIKKYKE